MTKKCKCQWILISNALIRIKPFPNQVQISYVENSYNELESRTWGTHQKVDAPLNLDDDEYVFDYISM